MAGCKAQWQFLEFDHIESNGKLFEVGGIAGSRGAGISFDRLVKILDEAAKTRLLCRMHHRDRTASAYARRRSLKAEKIAVNRTARRTAVQQKVLKWKLDKGKCIDCKKEVTESAGRRSVRVVEGDGDRAAGGGPCRRAIEFIAPPMCPRPCPVCPTSCVMRLLLPLMGEAARILYC